MSRLRTTRTETPEPLTERLNQSVIWALVLFILACGSILREYEYVGLISNGIQQDFKAMETVVQVLGTEDEPEVIGNDTASSQSLSNPDETVERLSEAIEHDVNETADSPTPATNTSLPTSNSSQWQHVDLDDPTAAWPNLKSQAYCCDGFYSGFRNQMMGFTGLVFMALANGAQQLVLESIRLKDTYGSNKPIPFEKLWDVPHWNSHYPTLPRLVHHDPVIHDQYDVQAHYWYKLKNGTWTDRGGVNTYEERTRPYSSKKQNHLFGMIQRYMMGKGPMLQDGHRRPEEKLVFAGAMRPHPKLREIIERCQKSLEDGDGDGGGGKSEYMTLHARVEPDMQKHGVCRDKKVLNLTQIFDFIEEKWPEPPVRNVFIPINRQYLEQEANEEHVNTLIARNKTDQVNWIAVENLRVLNQARDDGLWGGRVKVIEFGEKVLNNTDYSRTPSTPASLVNYHISIGAKIFIGTEVSSYSHDLLATRFYANSMENYKYLPDGLHDWTPPGTEYPPGHMC